MKKILLSTLFSVGILGLTLATQKISNVNATSPSYTLSFTRKDNNSNYATSYEVTDSKGIKWSVPGNQALGNSVKVGGKFTTETIREIFSIDPLSVNPSKIVINHSAKDSQITLKSLTVSAYSDSNKINDSLVFSSSVDAYNPVITFDNITAKQNLYYSFKWSMTSSSKSKNYGITITSIEFYEKQKQLESPSNLAFDNSTKTLTWDAVENADTYELTVLGENKNKENVYTTSTTSYDFSSFADDTYMVSIVAKDSTGKYTDSAIADTLFTIETSGPKLTSITYEGTPKTQYIGKEFNYEGLTFTPHYDSDNSNPEEILGSDINWPELKEGMTSITGTYRGIEITIDPIVVKEDVVESIEIDGDMTNKNYTINQDSFDSTGLTAIATYSSGETKDVTADTTFTFEKTPKEIGVTSETSIVVNAKYSNLTASKEVNGIVVSNVITDIILPSDLVVTSSGTGYKQFNDIKKNDAVYSGIAIKNNDSIQLNSSSNAGIYSKKQGGIISKISVEWLNGSNTLDIYCKNTPYSSGSDLYGDQKKQGTKIGSLKTSTTTTELTINGNYHFIGLRSAKKALYIKSITITYVPDTASSLAQYIMEENTEGQCETKFPVANDIYQMLTDEEKAKFVSSSSDEKIVNAVARYEAWAISLNVTNPYEAYSTTNGALISAKQDKNTIVYASLFGVISIATIVGFYLLKRKKA